MNTVKRVYQRGLSELLVRRWNAVPGISIHPSTRLIGAPIIELKPRATLTVGRGCRLVSVSERTALGVNHPLVVRAMLPGATIRLGDRVGISGGTLCAALSLTIGDGTLLGANVTIVDTDFHPIDHPDRWDAPVPEPRDRDAVELGRNCFVGTGAILLKGTRLGDNCVVGAGAVVSGQFEANSVIAGNPAKVVRQVRL